MPAAYFSEENQVNFENSSIDFGELLFDSCFRRCSSGTAGPKNEDKSHLSVRVPDFWSSQGFSCCPAPPVLAHRFQFSPRGGGISPKSVCQRGTKRPPKPPPCAVLAFLPREEPPQPPLLSRLGGCEAWFVFPGSGVPPSGAAGPPPDLPPPASPLPRRPVWRRSSPCGSWGSARWT